MLVVMLNLLLPSNKAGMFFKEAYYGKKNMACRTGKARR